MPSSAQAQQAGSSCPLTVNQEVAAVKAFKKLAPIFREPRCLNCHGGVNPFAADGDHDGGHIDIRKAAQRFLVATAGKQAGPDSRVVRDTRQIAQSPREITDNDVVRQKAHDAMRVACNQCHIPGWTIPMRVNHFVNKSDKDLCVHMKRTGAAAFLSHIRTDEDVDLGFQGRRGLKAPDPPSIPPNMSRGEMNRTAEDWVRAMGGKFHQPLDCGCVINGFVLQIQHKQDTDLTDIGYKMGMVEFSGTVDFAVRLEPVPGMPEGWFTGQVSVVRPMAVHHVRPDCSGKSAPRPEEWNIRAITDDEVGSMRFLFSLGYDDPLGTLTCTRGITTTMEVVSSMSSDLMHRQDLRIPVTTGAAAQFRAKEFDNREGLTVTVVQGPEGKE